jgi:hypothetical protein
MFFQYTYFFCVWWSTIIIKQPTNQPIKQPNLAEYTTMNLPSKTLHISPILTTTTTTTTTKTKQSNNSKSSIIQATWQNNIDEPQSHNLLLTKIKTALQNNDFETLEICSKALSQSNEMTRSDILVQVIFQTDNNNIVDLPIKLPDFVIADVGCVIWPAAIALCQYLSSTSMIFHNIVSINSNNNNKKPIHILELGCGVGTVGLFLAHLLQNKQINSRICMTDFNKACLLATQENCTMFSSQFTNTRAQLITKFMDWTKLELLDSIIHEDMEDIDIIVGAGIIYEPSHAKSIGQLLHHVLYNNNNNKSPPYIIISVQIGHEGVDTFMTLLDTYQLQIYQEIHITVATTNGWPNGEQECAILWIGTKN